MSVVSNNFVLDAVQSLQRAPSILKVMELLRGSTERHGYQFFLCSAPPAPNDPMTTNPILFEEWPEEWKRRYVDRRYFAHDPMLNELQRTADPFLWSEAQARRTASAPGRRIMGEAAELGMTEGYVVPIYGIGGQLHAITMTGKAPRRDALARAELHLISIYAYARAKQLKGRDSGQQAATVGRREREALQWAAAGKTDWEIGELLGISESAAHKRIESAKRKFGVATRVQAIVEALRRGQIQL